jgi:hypothetical protein
MYRKQPLRSVACYAKINHVKLTEVPSPYPLEEEVASWGKRGYEIGTLDKAIRFDQMKDFKYDGACFSIGLRIP